MNSNQLHLVVYYKLFHVFPQSSDKQQDSNKCVKRPQNTEFWTKMKIHVLSNSLFSLCMQGV